MVKGFTKIKTNKSSCKKGTYLPSNTSKNAYTGLNDDKTRCPKMASKTFPGIAKAMAEQWTQESKELKLF